mgnify:FL=1
MNTLCAAIQMASGPNINANLLEAERLITDAAKSGAKLVALPENFAFMGEHEQDKLAHKETEGKGTIQSFLKKIAKKQKVWIVAGTIPLTDPDNKNKVIAACLIYNDTGKQVARYDKIHLFDVHIPESNESYLESNSITKGEQPLVIDSPFGKLGIAICYDLRFPELFRLMQAQGAEIFIIPAAFTAKTGEAHWKVLLRARAIENLCYVIAPNQGGFHVNKRQTYGRSMIIDPWGTVLAKHKNNAGFAIAKLNIKHLKKLRKAFPVLEHRQIH